MLPSQHHGFPVILRGLGKKNKCLRHIDRRHSEGYLSLRHNFYFLTIFNASLICLSIRLAFSGSRGSRIAPLSLSPNTTGTSSASASTASEVASTEKFSTSSFRSSSYLLP